MLNTVSYADSEADISTNSVSLLPTLPNILFPDFSNTQVSVPADTEAPATEQFIVDSSSKASWAIACVLEAEDRINRRKALANEFKARIDAWLDSANKQDSNSISYLSSLLEPYVKDEVSKLHKSKTLSLPTGTASFRKLPDRLDIMDSETAIAYCESEHPEAVIIKKELDKSILKDLILKQAEPVPGVEAELGSDKLYIKPLKLQAPAF
jgi:phage host-nuclease inhibitor protein Gam